MKKLTLSILAVMDRCKGTNNVSYYVGRRLYPRELVYLNKFFIINQGLLGYYHFTKRMDAPELKN